MARVTCYAIILLFLLPVPFSFSMDVNDALKYILLIKDVHKYYKTTCIIIVHSDSDTGKFCFALLENCIITFGLINLKCEIKGEPLYISISRTFFLDSSGEKHRRETIIVSELDQTSLAYIWSRAFSQQGILTMIASFSELSHERKFQDYTTRPLCVIILATKENLIEFSTITRYIDVSFFVWLVMFLPYQENSMRNFCQNPIGNPFNLIFNTEMLVLCYDHPVLREWYALRDDKTRVFDLATWKSGQGLNVTTRNTLYARRNNLFGQTMRISIVNVSAMRKFQQIFLLFRVIPINFIFQGIFVHRDEEWRFVAFLGGGGERIEQIDEFQDRSDQHNVGVR